MAEQDAENQLPEEDIKETVTRFASKNRYTNIPEELKKVAIATAVQVLKTPDDQLCSLAEITDAKAQKLQSEGLQNYSTILKEEFIEEDNRRKQLSGEAEAEIARGLRVRIATSLFWLNLAQAPYNHDEKNRKMENAAQILAWQAAASIKPTIQIP